MASIVDDSKHVSNNNNKKNVLTIDAKEENIMEHDNNNNEHSETKIAVLEAMFLLQTEIPFFLKNVARVLKETMSLFDVKPSDGVVEQAGAGNVVIENKTSTIKGIGLIRGVRLIRANLTLIPQNKRSTFKTEMLPGKHIVLPQAVSSRNYTQRALEGTQAWLHSSLQFQQKKNILNDFNSNNNTGNKEIINLVYYHLEKAQIALEELTREISAARAVLSSSSTFHFPSLDDTMKVFTPKSIPKHVALRFDLYESDLQTNMF